MAARILDGNRIAAQIREESVRDLRALARLGVRPGLAVLLVGTHAASEIYVRNKLRACEELGILTETHWLPETVDTDALVAEVQELNKRDEIDGVLVQLPLPAHIDMRLVQMAVDPLKDIDGFHPINIGWLRVSEVSLPPCTPAGIIELLQRSQIPIEGAEAVVVGRSDVVGKPVATLFLRNNATITVCHSRTRDLPDVCRRGDIVVAAVGCPGLVTRDFIKPGATVIDVGINKVSDHAQFDQLFRGDHAREKQFAARGFVLAGDVHPKVAEVAGAITPVPGGVGPLTVAMSIVNTIKAARLRRGSAAPERAAC